MAQVSGLRRWIEDLPAEGRYTFTGGEASAVTEASPDAAMKTLRRLRRSGRLVSPRRGFHVIVPPEYRVAGSPPASWFIDHLMRHLGRPYYVALLTAAAVHGAGHQQSMSFQVMTNVPERIIEVGSVRIEFHASRLLGRAATRQVQTETGTMLVATPETTVFDLIRFPMACGGWSNVATVVAELAEELTPERLAEGSGRVSRSDTQRLGWILERVGAEQQAAALAERLLGERLVPVPLATTGGTRSGRPDDRWRVIDNMSIEIDA